MPNGMSGSDNSIAENLPPPPNLGRGRLIAPFRVDANAPNQNSAGKYPLISRPTQISTRVGVVQAIGRLPEEFLNRNKVKCGGRARKPRNHLARGAQTPLSQKVNLPPPRRVVYHYGGKHSILLAAAISLNCVARVSSCPVEGGSDGP
jgi:hypothetical protein